MYVVVLSFLHYIKFWVTMNSQLPRVSHVVYKFIVTLNIPLIILR
jgi:hypothetical protein